LERLGNIGKKNLVKPAKNKWFLSTFVLKIRANLQFLPRWPRDTYNGEFQGHNFL
jgi:hypothetical protein